MPDETEEKHCSIFFRCFMTLSILEFLKFLSSTSTTTSSTISSMISSITDFSHSIFRSSSSSSLCPRRNDMETPKIPSYIVGSTMIFKSFIAQFNFSGSFLLQQERAHRPSQLSDTIPCPENSIAILFICFNTSKGRYDSIDRNSAPCFIIIYFLCNHQSETTIIQLITNAASIISRELRY